MKMNFFFFFSHSLQNISFRKCHLLFIRLQTTVTKLYLCKSYFFTVFSNSAHIVSHINKYPLHDSKINQKPFNLKSKILELQYF